VVEKKEERAREKQQIQSGVQFTRVAYSGVERGGEGGGNRYREY